MMPVAYLDLVGGLSGDMFLAALLDIGLSKEDLYGFWRQLPFAIDLHLERVQRGGFSGCQLVIRALNKGPFPRTYSDICALLQKIDLDPLLFKKAQSAFRLLFEAEAWVHGKSLENVHLHELASYDTLADILGVLYGITKLSIEEFWMGPIPLGRGLGMSDHGALPLPAPAVLELLKGFVVYGIEDEVETITPTGAVLLRILNVKQGPIPRMCLKNIGVGVGQQVIESRPNILRIFYGEKEFTIKDLFLEYVCELEADIDDQSPELLAEAAVRLREKGAIDVVVMPLLMKKGRLGSKIKVLVTPDQTLSLSQELLRETGSLGVRLKEVKRFTLPRKIKKVKTPWGNLRVKFVQSKDFLYFKPEFEDVKALAQKRGLSLPSFYREIIGFLEHNKKTIFSDIDDKHPEIPNKVD